MKAHVRQHKKEAATSGVGSSVASASRRTATLDSLEVHRSTPQRACPVWKSNGANELLVRWLWRNLQPLDIVNDEGLKDLLQFFEPGYHVPSRTYVAGQLRLAHQVARDTLKVVLRDEGSAGLALTSDIWTS